jgi:hypothetical protein
MKIRIRCEADKRLRQLLEGHPHVALDATETGATLAFDQDGRERRIWRNRPDVELFGLVELIDNNPLVCATDFSLPSAGGTLATIALGPLLRSSLVCEPPAILLNFEEPETAILKTLATLNWEDGATIELMPADLGGILAATVMAVIPTPTDPEEIGDVFDEAFGRSFYVRHEEGDWHVNAVAGRPYAKYKLRLVPDEPTSLLTVQTMADRSGKCGAAQVVHAFNVMCGFEESLGISQ